MHVAVPLFLTPALQIFTCLIFCFECYKIDEHLIKNNLRWILSDNSSTDLIASENVSQHPANYNSTDVLKIVNKLLHTISRRNLTQAPLLQKLCKNFQRTAPTNQIPEFLTGRTLTQRNPPSHQHQNLARQVSQDNNLPKVEQTPRNQNSDANNSINRLADAIAGLATQQRQQAATMLKPVSTNTKSFDGKNQNHKLQLNTNGTNSHSITTQNHCLIS